MTTRRGFIRNTALAAAGLTIAPSLGASSKIVAPGDRINVGVIGCNGQGFSDLQHFSKILRLNALPFAISMIRFLREEQGMWKK